MNSNLGREELVRYGRHLILPEVGIEGQERLKAAKVVLVGAGGLGSPTALYLAAAGVGTIGIVDFDKVDLSNLHRQIIHGTSQIGENKVDSGEKALKEVNPHVAVNKHCERLTAANAFEILGKYDMVVDGTDNFSTRYLVNDACVLLGKPNVYGSIFKFDGQVSIFCAKGGPCYRCLFPEPPPPGIVPNCAEAGVLGVLPGVVGILQATEAIKLILGIGNPLIGRLMLYDSLGMTFRELQIARDPACPLCGESPSICTLAEVEISCGTEFPDVAEIDSAGLRELIKSRRSFTLIDVREPHEFETDRIEGSLLIPLGELEHQLHRIDKTSKVVVHCHSGARSARAVHILSGHGFSDAKSLRGGIVAWRDMP